jgi:putative phosphoesterase
MTVLDAFAEKEILAVCGNMDSSSVHKHLPAKRIWNTGLFKIGLIHGWGGRQGIEERIQGEFDGVDCIVYGHTHTPTQGRKNGVFFFNPGSFAGVFGRGQKTVGVLELGESISGHFYYL